MIGIVLGAADAPTLPRYNATAGMYNTLPPGSRNA